ncbi:hypothetical protein M0802_010142 [Mischocyttarus mexicanus]|nr:hypothetical protein M0802_010142 [Mischocyttarus mexicanus]
MYKKSKVHLMGNDGIVKFIQLYRSCECLWNVTSEDYGSKLSRNAAFDMISKKMGMPDLGPREVARKIQNLKSAYQQEIKKIVEKSLTGIVYRPRDIWFDLLDEFLQKSDKPMEIDDKFNGNRQSIDLSEMTQQTVSTVNGQSNLSNLTKNHSKYESNSDNESNTSLRKTKTSVVDVLIKDRQRKRRKKVNERIRLHEYRSFGKYVATNLKKMPFEYAISAETEIHSIIIKYKVYAMRKNVYPTINKTKTTKTTTTTMVGKHSSTYLPASNFSSILRHSIDKTQPK